MLPYRGAVPLELKKKKKTEKKNFSAVVWTWQGCQLSTTECEMHQNGLDPPLLLFASCTCIESQNMGDYNILFEIKKNKNI